jgi:DNA-binding NarL/FixJ family response regulator
MLKDKHPKLTAGDLKLCTYLRLNLASKDIAPLLNISVRSVELNRYRLRKKLEIPTETNLFDYLMQVKPVVKSDSVV